MKKAVLTVGCGAGVIAGAAFDLEARASIHWLHTPTHLGISDRAAVKKQQEICI